MSTRQYAAVVAGVIGVMAGCAGSETVSRMPEKGVTVMSDKVVKTEEEWRKILTPEEFRILREKGTERACTGEYHDSKKKGIFKCAGCGQPLFSSETKYDSGTGWPSFWSAIDDNNISTSEDRSLIRVRTEVTCSRCDGHLGHVFEDGPDPTGLRYCINSAALDIDENESPAR